MTTTMARPGLTVYTGGQEDESPYVTQFRRVITTVLGDCEDEPQGSQQVFLCPFPGCSGAGYRKKKLYVSMQSGAWCCHHCQFAVPGKEYRVDAKIQHGGTWREFAEYWYDDVRHWPRGRVGGGEYRRTKKLPTEGQRRLWWSLFEHSELLPQDAEKIRARGIDPTYAQMRSCTRGLFDWAVKEYGPETLVDAGLANFFSDTGRLNPALCLQPGRILVPYRTPTGCRYFIGYARTPARKPGQSNEEYENVKDRWVKAPGPRDFQVQLFGWVPQNAPYIIVTEGQLKAEAARQRGFPCVGLTGMGSQHRDVAEECVRQRARRVIILFDEEESDEENIDWCAEALARELLTRNLPAFRARLPLHPQKGKVDVDEFFLDHGTQDFIQVLASARPCILLGNSAPPRRR